MSASFTMIVQEQVDDLWKSRIKSSDFERNSQLTGSEIRTYLNNRHSLNTIDFVIRRYLVRRAKTLLDEIGKASGLSYSDLSAGLNESWMAEFLQILSKKLFQISKKRGIVLSAATWNRYLSGEAQRLNGETLFKIAFSLQMSVNDTMELMLASGQTTYCMRDPRQLIFYYCQMKPNAYSWLHAQELIRRFQEENGSSVFTAREAKVGMTHVLQDYVTELINSTLPEAEADDALIRFMVKNKREFSSLSLTHRQDLLRMASYLACMYPAYYAKGEMKKVTVEEDGRVHLDELVRAIFSEGGWMATTVSFRKKDKDNKGRRTSSSLKRRANSEGLSPEQEKKRMEADAPFLQQIQFFVDHLTAHLAAIDRVYRNPDHTQNVDRRDVILFTYFFIRQYPLMLEYEDDYGHELDKLTALLQQDSQLDACMDELMGMLYDLTYTDDEESWDYVPMFNLLLKHFDMHPIYMPCPYDRFIYMSLFADDPSAFTEAVLWNIGNETDQLSMGEEEKAAQQMADSLLDAKPCLIHVGDSEKIPITSPYFVIGRFSQPKADGKNVDKLPDYGFRTDKKAISRRHAVILFDGKDFKIADISKMSEKTAANRTRLNGDMLVPNPDVSSKDSPLHSTLLKDGDRISIYTEEFIFRYHRKPEA